MEIWIYFLAAGLIFAIVMYLLYCNGFVVTEVIAAVVLVFLPGKNSDKVKIVSCNGRIRHVGRFHESRIYQFSLDTQLSKGEAEVLLLDQKKRELLRLNRHSAIGITELDRGSRYYLHWEFKGATGKCDLHW